jgi:hypothetical protein
MEEGPVVQRANAKANHLKAELCSVLCFFFCHSRGRSRKRTTDPSASKMRSPQDDDACRIVS